MTQPSNLPQGTQEHKAKAEQFVSIPVACITVSDSRTEATDESGKLMQRLLTEAGHTIAHYKLLPNKEEQVREYVRELLKGPADAVFLTGGTGLGEKDRTVEAVKSLIDREIPGFGELFRYLSYAEQIGTASILSRALAGGAGKKLIVSMPGSRAAVDLALTRILIPELKHLIFELRR